MEALYDEAVRETRVSEASGDLAERKVRHAMHVAYVDEVLEKLAAEIGDVLQKDSVRDAVLQAAKRGEASTAVWTSDRRSYGWHETRDVDGVEYVAKPLPMAFLSLGPRKERGRRVHGQRFFAHNGIESLPQRLLFKASPFRVDVRLGPKNLVEVVLGWKTRDAEPEGEPPRDVEMDSFSFLLDSPRSQSNNLSL
jgi:hypothetical protein